MANVPSPRKLSDELDGSITFLHKPKLVVRAHTDERRATEVAVAVQALNRMLELGRPNYVRVA